MVKAGSDLKFRVTVDLYGFSIDEDDMELIIRNRWGQVCYKYKAEDFFADNQGRWYFAMSDVQQGIYYAYLTCYRVDEDFPNGYQKTVDKQFLINVGVCDCDCESSCEEATDGMSVLYERVWIVSLADGIYLADMYGNPILDKDGNYIRFQSSISTKKYLRLNMTAERFKELIEERNNNGVIDTVPEAFDLMGGFGEGADVSVMTEEETDNMMARILNSR